MISDGSSNNREGRRPSVVEHVILKAVHPTWLVVQLPKEVADLIQYHSEDVRGLYPPARGLAFLARGPGIVRVLPAFQAREVLAVETVRNRVLATSRVGDSLIVNLPAVVCRHLGLKLIGQSGAAPRVTDDSIIWFLPAPEYYEYRARQRSSRPWTGPSTGGFAHVYLAKSLLPFSRELTELENRIESEEWKPRMDTLAKSVRTPRRS